MLTRKTSRELALYQAAAKGCVEEVRALLATAPDVGALLLSTQDLEIHCPEYAPLTVPETSLMVALRNCHEEVAHTLLDAGEEVGLEMKAHFPTNPEHACVPISDCVGSSGLCSVALRLLKASGNHYSRMFSIVSALESAIQNNRVELVRTLLTAGADVNEKSWRPSLLACAVEHGHLTIVNILLEAGADVHYKDQYLNSLIMTAVCSKGSVKDRIAILRLLLDSGADIHSRYRGFELTPLMQAVGIKGGVEVVRELITAGADVFMRGYVSANHLMEKEDYKSYTALNLAVGDAIREVLRREMDRRTVAALLVLNDMPESVRREIIRIVHWK